MRVLMLKSVNHILINELVKRFQHEDIQVDVVDISLGVGINGRLQTLLNIIKFIFVFFVKCKRYDVISVQYVSVQSILLIPLFYLFGKKIVLSF